MNLEPGRSCHGFKLVRREPIAEINNLALLFEHEQTGAELMVLENDDDNKVFSITFRTPPANDRGVAHILEHSVLCGSEKFPVKEPFVELMKGSLQTFLNAMTFPDKTMYPVASRNDKDFRNLMTVYLDAVFFPRITPEIFMQEGWHYELDDLNGDIVYKGVVFNEMKGVFSNPEGVLDRVLAHSLFPKTPYGYESGGDPLAIPDLTYEEFRDFHARLYHPSNSRIFLYGDGDTETCLEFLNDAYLSRFQRQEVDSALPVQRRFSKPRRKRVLYPVSKGESLEKKTYVVMGMKLGRSTEPEHCLAMEILSHILVGTAASPLRKALLESRLGSEVIGGGFDDNRLETLFAVGLKGTDPDKEQDILDLIFSTLERLATEGIDPNQVKASVNTIDFKLREANFGGFPKGIVYNIHSLGSWLHGADPLEHLRYEALMKKIKRKSAQGYFENLIRKFLLDNRHRSVVVLEPSAGLAERQEARVRKKLRALKQSLPAGELEQMVEKTATLQALQAEADPPEKLATLPALELSDVNSVAPQFPNEVRREAAPQILFHDLFTNKIAYTQLCFNTRNVPRDKIQYLPLLGRLMLGMGTRRRDYVDMSQQIGIRTGGIHASHFSSVPVAERDRILSFVNFNGTALVEKAQDLFDLYHELLVERDFSNHKRLVEIIRSARANREAAIVPSGNQYVLARLQSYSSQLGRYDEITDGITYYRFLEELEARVERDPAEVAECFREVADRVFTLPNLLVNITCREEEYRSGLERRVEALAQALPAVERAPEELHFGPVTVNEGLMTASSVQYVGKGANLYEWGFEFSGKFDVLKSILRTGYLWDRVRVQGGAYGSSVHFDHYTGDFGMVSYRDPNLEETLRVYDEVADFLDRLDLKGKELEKIIIGCVGAFDPPLTADRKGAAAKVEFLTGLSQEFKQKRLEDMLATGLDDIRAFSSLFHRLRDEGRVCVLGGEARIRKAARRFEHLEPVFK